VDVTGVQEVLRQVDMTPVPLAPPDVVGLINLRGHIVTVLELRRRRRGELSLFSGTSFNVDDARGLTVFCDWLIARSPEQLTIEAPVVAIVEAKNENIRQGIPQCAAEMYASRLFHEQRGASAPVLFGAVTTGSAWVPVRPTAS
jgi:hypothetical protein